MAKDPHFEKIDIECEKYIENIEKGYVRFLDNIDNAQCCPNNINAHTSVFSFFNVVFRNYVSILRIRNELTEEMLLKASNYSELKNPNREQLSVLRKISTYHQSLALFSDIEKEITDAFFSCDLSKGSFFRYIDSIINRHIKWDVAESKAAEVKSGMVIPDSEKKLVRSIKRFLESYYPGVNLKNVSDEILKDFIAEKSYNPKSLYRIKLAVLDYLSSTDSWDKIREKTQKIEVAQGLESNSKSGFEKQKDQSVPYIYGIPKSDLDEGNSQWNFILEKCESEFKKEKRLKNKKYISYTLTAYLINKKLESLKNGTNYKKTVLLNKYEISDYILQLKKYSFFSPKIVDVFVLNKDQINQKEVAKLLDVHSDTIRNNFKPFLKRVGLPQKFK